MSKSIVDLVGNKLTVEQLVQMGAVYIGSSGEGDLVQIGEFKYWTREISGTPYWEIYALGKNENKDKERETEI